MHLSDCFINLMACVAYTLPEVERKEIPYADFRAAVMCHVDHCGVHPARDGVEEEDYSLARFAVFCWIDDRVMQSSWKGKNQWQKESLQRVYFKTAQGGAEFFTRLKEVDSSRKGVLEVYYLCLLAGFRGRYGQEEDEQILDDLKAGIRKKMGCDHDKLTGDGHVTLFPAAYQGVQSSSDEAVRAPNMPLFHRLFLFSPVFLYGCLFGVYRFILNSEVLTSLVP